MKLRILLLSAALTVLAISPLAAADLKADMAALQGKWKGTLTSDRGSSTWTLEIKDKKTKVQIMDSQGEVVFKGEGDFKLEQVGPFKAYTYYNIEVQSGDNAGQKFLTGGETRSSIYKLQGDTFITAGGFSPGDDTEPRIIKWTRQQ